MRPLHFVLAAGCTVGSFFTGCTCHKEEIQAREPATTTTVVAAPAAAPPSTVVVQPQPAPAPTTTVKVESR